MLWENGYNESFNGSLRDELRGGEIFYSLAEAKVLIEAWRLATSEGGCVSLANPQPPVARILHTTGLDRRIKVYPDVASAVAAG